MSCEWVGFCSLQAEAQAAWAQAVLSVLGIAIAIWIPARASRLERKRRVATVLALLSHIHESMCDVLGAIKPGADMRLIVPTKEKLDRLIAAAEAIPFHELPDPGIAYPLIAMIDHARDFRMRTGWLSEVNHLESAAAPIQQEVLSRIADSYHRELMSAYRAAHAQVLSLWDRFSSWWRFRKVSRQVTQGLRKSGKEP
jgi:hypothetical protein